MPMNEHKRFNQLIWNEAVRIRMDSDDYELREFRASDVHRRGVSAGPSQTGRPVSCRGVGVERTGRGQRWGLQLLRDPGTLAIDPTPYSRSLACYD